MKKIIMFIFLLGSFQGYAQWSNTADNITTGNLTIGSTVTDSYSKFTIKGPNQPTGINNKRDISFEFSSAGQAQIRSYRGTSWDTYLQFLTSDHANTGGIPTPRLHINHDGKIGIGTATPFTGSNNFGLHIDAGDHTSILLGSPISEGFGGILQTSDNKHRVFIGANLYDDKTLAWKSFQAGKGSAGISIVADNGGWGTNITMYASDQDNSVTPRFIITSSGNTGIGTTTPVSKLQVVGTTNAFTIGEKITGNTILDIGLNQQTSGYSFVQSVKAHGSLWGDLIINEKGGNVGIGINDTKGYKLAIAGNMIAEQVTVKLKANWPDYVFTPSYNLPSLKETEQHIKEKGHLPGIPSAEEVKNNGVDLGEMNAKLLQKIEELTLYLIELKKENESLNIRVNQLENSKKRK